MCLHMYCKWNNTESEVNYANLKLNDALDVFETSNQMQMLKFQFVWFGSHIYFMHSLICLDITVALVPNQ